MTLSGGTTGSYFKLEGISVKGEGSGSNTKITLPKCLATSLPAVSLAEEDYATFSVTATCLPRAADGQFLVVTHNVIAATL